MQVFWTLSGTVPRLLAGERRDILEISTSAAYNPDAAVELYKQLSDQSPDPVTLSGHGMLKISSVRDEDGLNELRSLA